MLTAITELIDFIYPDKCLSCGTVLSKNENALCSLCKSCLLFINPKKRCMRCGLEKEFCQCSKRVYRFENIISVFEYTGIARQIMKKYKFAHKMHYADFFAKHMADSVKNEYKNIKFSIVTYVPTSSKNRSKRGYDQSEVLSKRISKILGIRSVNMLGCRKFVTDQHKSDFKNRLSNVKGKYYFKKRLHGGNVLLVDDIKTTGATLDECARQLLLSGADKVYCVTALETVYRPKIKKLEK